MVKIHLDSIAVSLAGIYTSVAIIGQMVKYRVTMSEQLHARCIVGEMENSATLKCTQEVGLAATPCISEKE